MRGYPVVQRGLQADAVMYDMQSFDVDDDEPIHYLLQWQHGEESVYGRITNPRLINIEGFITGRTRDDRVGEEVRIWYDPDSPGKLVAYESYAHASRRLAPCLAAVTAGVVLQRVGRPRKCRPDTA